MNKIFTWLTLSVLISTNAFAEGGNPYCTPVHYSPCNSNDYIKSFSLNTLVKNNSGCNGNTDNYIYDESATTSVEQGEAYPISMQAGSQSSQGFGVWIDYNQNGSFSDPNEFVYASPSAGTQVFSGFIAIPNTALSGVTRLRVRCNYASTIAATDFCTPFSYGETEDYNINITQAPPCNNPPKAGTTISSKSVVCDTLTPFTLTLKGSSNGAGQTYQWQKSPNGTSWTNISGAVSKVYTDTIKQTKHFRCVVTCVGTSTSTPVVVTLSTPFSKLDFDVTDVSCYGLNDGAITALLSGGSNPYTYEWTEMGQGLHPNNGVDARASASPSSANMTIMKSDSFPNAATIDSLYSGYYYLTVTDANGCKVYGSGYVSQPDNLDISGNTTPSTCSASDGSVSVSVYGGTTPYSYLWQGGQTTETLSLLPSGIYSVTVTDNHGCSKKAGIPLSDLGAPALSFTTTPSTCHGVNDGSIKVEVIGNGPFTYSWNTTPAQTTDLATGLSPGNYFVTVKNPAGCKSIKQQDAYQPDALDPNAYIGSFVSCPGNADGFLGVYVYGGTPGYTYQWSSGSTESGVQALKIGNYTVTVTDANGCVASDTIHLYSPATINLSVQKSSLLCNAVCTGTASATVTGGYPPYTYQWMPGNYTTKAVSGLCAGTYTLLVKDADDANCSFVATRTFTITEPTAFVVSNGVPVNVSCNGFNDGSASLNVSGGTTPYTYTWSPSGQTTQTASNLASNTYSVIVSDANGCSVTPPSITITQPAALTASVSAINLLCNAQCNGSISLSASGGTVPYTYNWNSGSTTASTTGLCAGDYSVTISDSKGCTLTKNTTLTQPSPLSVTTTAADASCYNKNDGSAASIPSGGVSPYTYLWLPGNLTAQSISGLAPATYTLTLSDANGCTLSNTSLVTQPAALTLTVTKTDAGCNDVCSGLASVNVIGGSSPYSYAWSPSGNISPNASALCAGLHTITVFDDNNCTISDTVSVLEPLAVPLTVTVTPTSCGANSGTASASVVGPGSVPPFDYLWTNGSSSSFISGLDAGIYRVNVTDGNGCFGFADALVTSSNGPTIITTSITDVSCSGLENGAIDISVTGGTVPYTYFWSNGKTTEDVSNLAYGPQEVKVTDASGCLVVKSIFVNQPAPLSMTHSVVNSGCNASNGSATVIVKGGTSPYVYWWASGGTDAINTGLGAGIYEVTLTDSKGCRDSIMIAVQDSGGPVVIVDTMVAATCGNGGYILLLPLDSGSIAAYQWNTGSTTQNLTNATPGNYGVTITDTSGCKSVLVTPVNPVLPPIKPICLVTVDTITHKNMVVWEKPSSSFIAGFNIYRESSQQGIYQKIGYSPYSSVSTFYDLSAEPSDKWTRYRISMTDICGVEGPVSPNHKTIHLAIQSANADSTHLVWSAYVGYPFGHYNIYRKDSTGGIWTLIDTVPSTSTTYSDTTFPNTGDTIYYHVDVNHGGGDCIATLKNPTTLATTVKSSKSNSSDRLTSPPASMNDISDNTWLIIYPNPSSGNFTLSSSRNVLTGISIYNMLGENVYHKNLNTKQNEVSIPGIENGVYEVRITTPYGVANRKIVISR